MIQILRAIVRPSIINVIYINDSSASVMTMDPNHDMSTVSHYSKVVQRKGEGMF